VRDIVARIDLAILLPALYLSDTAAGIFVERNAVSFNQLGITRFDEEAVVLGVVLARLGAVIPEPADVLKPYKVLKALGRIFKDCGGASADFYKALSQKFGVSFLSFRYTSDWLKPDDTPPDKEILVGETNREETRQVLEGLQEFDYAIAMVGSKLVICGGSDEATLQAMAYFTDNIMTGNTLELPENFSYICTSPPRILSYSPENYYYYEDVYTPELVINYVCSPAVDRTASKLAVNGKDYTAQANWEDGRVTLSSTTFEAGDYEVSLTLYDTNGNPYRHTQYFSCGDGSVMHLYKGEVHAHTSESDGEGTVEAAYAYARDVAKLDFFAITDHSNSINLNTYKNTPLYADMAGSTSVM
jgi:hypothetical protein